MNKIIFGITTLLISSSVIAADLPSVYGLANTQFDGESGYVAISGQLAAELYTKLEVPEAVSGDYKTKQGENYTCKVESDLVYECTMIIENAKTGKFEKN